MQRLHKLHRVRKSFFIVSSVRMYYSCCPSKVTTFRSYKVPKFSMLVLFCSALSSLVVLVMNDKRL